MIEGLYRINEDGKISNETSIVRWLKWMHDTQFTIRILAEYEFKSRPIKVISVFNGVEPLCTTSKVNFDPVAKKTNGVIKKHDCNTIDEALEIFREYCKEETE